MGAWCSCTTTSSVMRGAERTFEAMAACFPDAPIATLLHDPIGTEGRFRRSARADVVPAARRRGPAALSPLPAAAAARRSSDCAVSERDLVISSSSAFAHGVRPAPDAIHVCYCHSPFRYVWHERRRTEERFPLPLRPLAHGALGAVRRWDVAAPRAASPPT